MKSFPFASEIKIFIFALEKFFTQKPKQQQKSGKWLEIISAPRVDGKQFPYPMPFTFERKISWKERLN